MTRVPSHLDQSHPLARSPFIQPGVGTDTERTRVARVEVYIVIHGVFEPFDTRSPGVSRALVPLAGPGLWMFRGYLCQRGQTRRRYKH